jgi:hypothetical protein
MERYFETHGIYNHSSHEVRNYLLEELEEHKVPSLVTVRRIMKLKFNLRFKKLDKANTKYRDSSYNEKRLWVSRLVAQFLMEDAVVICVDESNFRHDALPNKQW